MLVACGGEIHAQGPVLGEAPAAVGSPSAVEAQRQVSVTMAQGMTDSGGVGGVETCAVGHAVSHVNIDKDGVPLNLKPCRMGWMAQQRLKVRCEDGERPLSLAGKLQDESPAVTSLDWHCRRIWNVRPATRRW
jgi:hypothetical protein